MRPGQRCAGLAARPYFPVYFIPYVTRSDTSRYRMILYHCFSDSCIAYASSPSASVASDPISIARRVRGSDEQLTILLLNIFDGETKCVAVEAQSGAVRLTDMQ